MNPTKRTPQELIWLKRAWFLARCEFKLSESPGFEAHSEELKAFEKAWRKHYREWEPMHMELADVEPGQGMDDISLYTNEIVIIEEAKELELEKAYLEDVIKQANKLGMSPRASSQFLALENKVSYIQEQLYASQKRDRPRHHDDPRKR